MSRHHPYMTIEDVLSMPRLSGPAVSEDGGHVAWVEAEPHWDKNEYRRHVHVFSAVTGQTTVVTGGERQGKAPAWSPHGTLAFLSPVGEGDDRVDQIFVLDRGRAVQVTQGKPGVTGFRWGPCGGLYYLAPDPEQKERLKRRRERYGDLEYVDVDGAPGCLFYLEPEIGMEASLAPAAAPRDLRGKDAAGDPARRLAGGPGCHVLRFDVSPDGRRIVYTAAPSPNPEDFDQAGIYLLDIDGGVTTPLSARKPIDGFGSVLFSPCGASICYTRPINEGRWFNISTVETMDLGSGRTEQPLIHVDECIYPLRWTGRGLVFTWQQRTDWYVSVLEPGGRVTGLSAGTGTVTLGASVSADGGHLATLTATREQPFEVYLDGRRITDQGRHYRDRTTSHKEIVTWNSSDGTPIEGVLITPPELCRDRRHPLLVVVHGGPTWAALAVPTSDPYYPYEQFIDRGFIILDVNYRGSSGYGEAFRKLNYRNLGLGDVEDVTSGIDMLVEQGLADGARVGVMGWSQGGYISAMCATYSDRFSAVSAGAGISNWYTYYLNTDIHPFTRHYLGDTPWNDPEIYARTSPITYVRRASTPTLIQHGDRDARVPAANALELYQGLRDMGVDVKLVLFKGMGHGAEKPGLHRAIMHQNLAWFCHHLLGDDLGGFWLDVEDGPRGEADPDQ